MGKTNFTKQIIDSKKFTVGVTNSGEFTINVSDCKGFTVNISDCQDYTINEQDVRKDSKISNDLISRSTAEKLLREYADEVGCNRGEYELANGILKAVNFLNDSENIPTAYDLDKVVEQIKENENDFRNRKGRRSK